MNPIQPGRILFLTFQGEYTCNPKYICNKLLERNYPGDLIWVVDAKEEKKEGSFPAEVELVERGTKEYYKALYSANVWIDNAFNVTREFVWKKRGQIYIETMHGSLGIKRIGSDSVRNGKRNQRGFRCGKLTDYIIANSVFEEEVYRTSFWKNTFIWKMGHARNDILLNESDDERQRIHQKVRKYFGISSDKKIILYAPTFRDQHAEVEELDIKSLLEEMEKKHGGKWVVIVREHHRDKQKMSEKSDDMLNGNNYADIQELMLAAEIGITDYSSWIFDFMLLRKPAFLCVFDEKIYKEDRGFYYPLEETPFPIAHSNKELKEHIKHFNQSQYEEHIDSFVKRRGCYENGEACNRIVDEIIKLVEGKR
ncbi:MAG: CDP-glycerol--poly(glycerophosphate) glycerophosphotransferase [Lachnospiraceae bacterium]|nr:CDP-glycerol--poly(glycerophosphate) glycerophosphotransferase [Lachnospiraceae bacterium]